MAKSSKTSRHKSAGGKYRQIRASRKVMAETAASRRDKRNKSKAQPTRGKIDSIATMLRRAKGATIAQLCAATGWQTHSVRAAISQAIKKKRGLDVRSEKVGATRVYRIEI